MEKTLRIGRQFLRTLYKPKLIYDWNVTLKIEVDQRMNKNLFSKNYFALFIALLFHVCGAIGILFTPYRQWFINATPFNLLLMAALLVFTQPKKNLSFFIFFFIAFTTGFAAEIIGVHSGTLFGNYEYGNILGKKLFDVPLLIGLNWFVIIFCAGSLVYQFNEWVYKKLGDEMQLSQRLKTISFIIDAALLTTFFDWVLEPVAIKLGYWVWLSGSLPSAYNYVCWFLLSAVLLAIFKVLKFSKQNQFAVHLFIIQLIFFLALSI